MANLKKEIKQEIKTLQDEIGLLLELTKDKTITDFIKQTNSSKQEAL